MQVQESKNMVIHIINMEIDQTKEKKQRGKNKGTNRKSSILNELLCTKYHPNAFEMLGAPVRITNRR